MKNRPEVAGVGVTVAAEPPLGMDILCGPFPPSVPGPARMNVQCGQCPLKVSRLQRGPKVRQATLPGRVKSWGECSQLHVDLQPRPHKRGRAQGSIQPTRARLSHPRPVHSQYLMTAMLTGAVQVTATSGFSEAMAEEHGNSSPQPSPVQIRAAEVPSSDPRDPSCSCAVQSAADLAHAPPLSQ